MTINLDKLLTVARTVADLAGVTGLSIGMLSKIENGITSPSLTTLQILSHAFSTPITSFFRGFEERREVQHVKAGDHIEIERRGTRAGHQYHLLGHIGSNDSGVVVEPYLITLTTESDVFPAFQHDGLELLFMLAVLCVVLLIVPVLALAGFLGGKKGGHVCAEGHWPPSIAASATRPSSPRSRQSSRVSRAHRSPRSMASPSVAQACPSWQPRRSPSG